MAETIFIKRDPRLVPPDFDQAAYFGALKSSSLLGDLKKVIESGSRAAQSAYTSARHPNLTDWLALSVARGAPVNKIDRFALRELGLKSLTDLAKVLWDAGFEMVAFDLAQHVHDKVIGDEERRYRALRYAEFLIVLGRADAAIPIIEECHKSQKDQPKYRFLLLRAHYHHAKEFFDFAKTLKGFYRLCLTKTPDHCFYLYKAYVAVGNAERDVKFLHAQRRKDPQSIPAHLALLCLGVEDNAEIVQSLWPPIGEQPDFHVLLRRVLPLLEKILPSSQHSILSNALPAEQVPASEAATLNAIPIAEQEIMRSAGQDLSQRLPLQAGGDMGLNERMKRFRKAFQKGPHSGLRHGG